MLRFDPLPTSVGANLATADGPEPAYLGERVERGELFLRTEAGTEAVSASEVALRFNNWDKIRASRLPIAAIAAVLTAVGLVLIVGCVVLGGRRQTES